MADTLVQLTLTFPPQYYNILLISLCASMFPFYSLLSSQQLEGFCLKYKLDHVTFMLKTLWPHESRIPHYDFGNSRWSGPRPPSLVRIQSYWPSDPAYSYFGAIVLAIHVVWNIPASFSSFFLLSKAIPDQHIKILITTSIPTTNSILLFWFFFLALTVNTP